MMSSNYFQNRSQMRKTKAKSGESRRGPGVKSPTVGALQKRTVPSMNRLTFVVADETNSCMDENNKTLHTSSFGKTVLPK